MRVRLVWLGFNRHLHIIAMELFTAPLQRPAQKSVFFLFFPKTNVSPHVAVIRQPVELTAPPKSIRFSAVSREKQTYAVLRLGFLHHCDSSRPILLEKTSKQAVSLRFGSSAPLLLYSASDLPLIFKHSTSTSQCPRRDSTANRDRPTPPTHNEARFVKSSRCRRKLLAPATRTPAVAISKHHFHVLHQKTRLNP